MFLDDEISSLVSLMGLLEPSEYFVTVDNSALWQKHICWAKSTGKDLRQYITQRYASSVVFLSCLLAAQVREGEGGPSIHRLPLLLGTEPLVNSQYYSPHPLYTCIFLYTD